MAAAAAAATLPEEAGAAVEATESDSEDDGGPGLLDEPEDPNMPMRVFSLSLGFWAFVVSLMVLAYFKSGDGALFRIDIAAFAFVGATASLLVGLFLLEHAIHTCGDGKPVKCRDHVENAFAWIKVMGFCTTMLATLVHANWFLALCFAVFAGSAFVLWCSSVVMLLVKECGASVETLPLVACWLLRASRLALFAIFLVFALLEAGAIYFKEEGVMARALGDLGLSFALDLRRWELLLYTSACGLVLSLFLAPAFLAVRARSLQRGDFADPALDPTGDAKEAARRPPPEEGAGEDGDEPALPERRLEEGAAAADAGALVLVDPKRDVDQEEEEESDDVRAEPDVLESDPGLCLRVTAPVVAFCALVVSLLYLSVYGAGDDSKARIDFMAYFLSGSTAFALSCAFLFALFKNRCLEGPRPNDREWVLLMFAWLKGMGLIVTLLALLGHQTWIPALLFATCAAFLWVFWCASLAAKLVMMLGFESEDLPLLVRGLARANRLVLFVLFAVFALLEAGAIYFKDSGHADSLGISFISELRRWELLLYTSACGMLLSLVLTPLFLLRRARQLRTRQGAGTQIPRGCRLFAVAISLALILHLNAVFFFPLLAAVAVIALPLAVVGVILGGPPWLCWYLCCSEGAGPDDDPVEQRLALKDAPGGVGGLREEARREPEEPAVAGDDTLSEGLEVLVEVKPEAGGVQLLGVQAQKKVIVAKEEAAPAIAAHNEARAGAEAAVAAKREEEEAQRKRKQEEEGRREEQRRLEEEARRRREEEEEARRAEQRRLEEEAQRRREEEEEARQAEQRRLEAEAQRKREEEEEAAREEEQRRQIEELRKRQEAEEEERREQERRRKEELEAELARAREEQERAERERAEEEARLKAEREAEMARLMAEAASAEEIRLLKLREEEEERKRVEEEKRRKEEAAKELRRLEEAAAEEERLRREEEKRRKAEEEAKMKQLKAEAEEQKRLAKQKSFQRQEEEERRQEEEKARQKEAQKKRQQADAEARQREAEEKKKQQAEMKARLAEERAKSAAAAAAERAKAKAAAAAAAEQARREKARARKEKQAQSGGFCRCCRRRKREAPPEPDAEAPAPKPAMELPGKDEGQEAPGTASVPLKLRYQAEDSGSDTGEETDQEAEGESESDSNVSDDSASVNQALPAMLRGIAAAAGVPEERVTFTARPVSKRNEHVSAMMQDATSMSVEVHFEIAAAPAEIDSMRATLSAPDMAAILQHEVNQALVLDGTLRASFQCPAVPSVFPVGVELADDPVQAEKDMDARRAAISARSNNTTQPLNSMVFLGTSSTLTAPARFDETGATQLPWAAATFGDGTSFAPTASMPLGGAAAASSHQDAATHGGAAGSAATATWPLGAAAGPSSHQALRSSGGASPGSPGPPNTSLLGSTGGSEPATGMAASASSAFELPGACP